MTDARLCNETLGRFLERLASNDPAPGGGAAAAVAAAMAAALVAMVARFSTGPVGDAQAVVDTADALRRQALQLADDDAAAYTEVLSAYAVPKDSDPEFRQRKIAAALERASDVPLEITRVAAEAVVLGLRLSREGNPNLKGDAEAAVLLGRAAAGSAANLVELNVRLGKLDGHRLERLAEHLGTAGGMTGPSEP